MTLTNFENGITSFGIPVLGGGGPFTTGNVFFVGSTVANAVDSGTAGSTPDVPFATIDYAVGKCTANNGDVILVMPGHAETVSAAGDIALDVAGIKVIGIGDGADTPTITFDTATSADVDVDAANVTIENIHFIANFADVAVMIDVNADDFTCRNCRFTEAGTDLNAKICVQLALSTTSDRCMVEGCHAIMPDAANTHFVSFTGVGTGHVIRNNRLLGDWGTAAIGGAGAVTYCLIEGNLIYNAANANDSCIQVTATGTGIVYNNHCGGGAAAGNGITATACTISQNYYQLVTADLSGVLDPPSV